MRSGCPIVQRLALGVERAHAIADLAVLALRRGLVRWLHSARAAGLGEESILALFLATFQSTRDEKEDTA